MTQWLATGFESGRVLDAILLLVVVEALILVGYHRLTGRGIASLDLLPNLASGLCLLLALRAALSGLHWVWVAAPLTLSLLAHGLDLAQRWRENVGHKQTPGTNSTEYRSGA